MENATKALLIAAAVLIVILLIAFGMSIFNSTGDVSEQSQAVGSKVTESSKDAVVSLSLTMKDQVDPDTFYQQLKDAYAGKQSGARVKKLWNILEKYNTSSPHDHNKAHISCYGGTIKDTGVKLESYNIDDNKLYTINFAGGYSITIN